MLVAGRADFWQTCGKSRPSHGRDQGIPPHQSGWFTLDLSLFLEIFRTSLKKTDPGDLRLSDRLADIPGWDSIAFLTFVLEVEVKANVILLPSQLGECRTLGDLFALTGGKP